MADIAGRDVNRNVTLQALDSLLGTSTVNLWANPVTHALLVSGTFTPSGTTDVNISQVGGSTTKTVDSASGSTDPGIPSLFVRDDVLTVLTPVDGDYVPGRTDKWGNLWVSLGTRLDSTNDSVTATQATAANLNATVVGTGTFVVQATLAAETTKVIGTVNQGTSPWVVSLASTTITGTVAATQSGTWNITNISGTVSLPTGASTLAEQQTQSASLSVLDDWDETNRAAVNTIAGQVGVQGGSGSVSALTQRVVLATDVALPAGTNSIGKLGSNSGVDIGDVDVTSIAAGNNNIGDVDVASVPSDPFGVNADASSATGSISAKLRFLAAGIAGATSLPAGTNLIGNVGNGKTIKSVTGTVSVDTDIVAAVPAKRIKVIAYSLISVSTTSNIITFQSNASTALWTTPLQAITGTISGSNLSTTAPSFLFATTAGEKLTLDVSAAQNVTYNVTYFDDDAT